jgi:hypothetical protein
MPGTDEPLGPLPKGDRQDTLQQQSLIALHSAMPTELFLFRDERVDDKGVDGALEAKADGGFTNCRGQFQLKATDSSEQNQDGSVSCTVAASNLNYLGNGPSPLYFLWIAPRNELRFAWAHDERKKLDEENPSWMEQESITLRFKEILDGKAINAIHQRIINEARLHRRIHDGLARTTTGEQLHVRIERETLRTTDPKQAEDILRGAGMALVAAGFGQEVLDLVRLLNRESAETPRIQLTCAYANQSLGKHQAALACLGEAESRVDDLSPGDRQFLGTLRDACHFSLGRLTLDEYSERQDAWAKEKKGMSALEHRLENLRYARLRERDFARYQELGLQLRDVARQIIEAKEDAGPTKLQARILVTQDEGEERVRDLVESLTLVRMRQSMKMPVGSGAIAQQLQTVMTRLREWEQKAEEVVKAAWDAFHPLLFGDALLARLGVRVGLLLQQRFDAIGNNIPWELPEAARLALMQDGEAAREIYSRAGNREGECRAKLLLADLFEVAGQQDAARQLAEGVLPVTRGMGYTRLEERALEHIQQTTILRKFEKRIAERRTEDEDYDIAASSDQDLRQLSQACIDSSQLPQERLPIVVREWLSQRRIAQERIDWCRHLLLLQNLLHEQHPSTHYATDPPRLCACDKYGYRSAIEHPDYEFVIDTFKQTYCKDCPGRSPKGPPQQPT